MKIKLIALAVAALVSGVANAAIDSGNPSGNGNLLFTAWDANSSYTLNTGYTIDSFEAALKANSNFLYSFSSTALQTWLSGADYAGGVSFSVFAAGVKGASRVITSTQNDAANTFNNFDATGLAVAGSNFIGSNLNANGGPFAVAGVYEAVSTSDKPAYTGSTLIAVDSNAAFTNYGVVNTGGTSDALGLMRIDAKDNSTGKLSTSFAYTGATAYLSNGTFKIAVAAVPEPETLAMLLAGIGMIGSIVRRRSRTAA